MTPQHIDNVLEAELAHVAVRSTRVATGLGALGGMMIVAGIALLPFGAVVALGAAVPLLAARRVARGLGPRLTAGMNEPLIELSAAYGPVADGDLRVRAEEDREGEVGNVARIVNGALTQVDDVIGRASGSTATLSRAAAEMEIASGQARAAVADISETVNSVAIGASEQASAAERAAAAIEDIHGGLAGVAEQGSNFAEAAGRAESAAADGVATLRVADGAMAEITGAVNQATAVVGELDGHASQIGEIVGAIEKIAQQTNLLALNASIEAARAGESGRGFAVVAEEVRQLAEDTQLQVGSIAEIVTQIQESSREAIQATAAGAAAVESGSAEMVHVAEAFDAIREQVAAVAADAGAVATESARLQHASNTVRDEMSSVAAVAEENAAAAQQVAASTVETTSSVELVEGASAQVAASVETLQQLIAGYSVSAVDVSQANVGGADLEEVVQAALSAHAAWKDRLHTAIADGTSELDPANVRKDDGCPFGVWLHGPDAAGVQHSAQYEKVHDLHATFHEIASEVLSLAISGETQEAERRMAVGSDFHRVSSQLSQALTGWRHAAV